ncbi:chorismate mutase family protein [Pararhizobium antarcticum]|uniref:chorismate mutase n=1 Tax=Pararhizobium antarcticum TaxID=1798805 RepID=A0A657LZE2_9HYPH|nr:chorismate mutase family protein [Pararhizobium antarcticum]OJF98484.1 chorismate mutase [Rhizobium sp. 58]OJG00984.1 chorismate mutase [Pararhizobium antarcticum]
MAKAPADCTSMTDIRQEIDRIDQALMALFGERWDYIGRAAEIKRGTGLKADIPARVEEVRSNVRALAATLGLQPDFYDTLWAALIRQAIEHEKDILGETAD